MATLADLENLLTRLGAPANLVAPLAAIPTAEDTSGSLAANPDSGGSTSVGWWQINSANFSWLSQYLGTPVNAQTLTDPTLNAKAAIAIATQTPNGLNNWTTWTAYQQAKAGASGLTVAQQAAATKINSALGAIGAGNAASTPYGTATGFDPSKAFNPFDPNYWTQNGGPAGAITSGGNNTTPTPGNFKGPADAIVAYFQHLGDDWKNFVKPWSSPGAVAVIMIAVGVLVVAWLLAQSHDDETNVTIAAPAAGAAAA